MVVLGVYAAAQAVMAYGFYPNCGAPTIGSCPNTLGSSGAFLGGIFAVVAGIGVSFYALTRWD